MAGSHFHQTIEALLTNGVIRLFGKIEQFDPDDDSDVVSILEDVYHKESLSYPGKPPVFDAKAGLFGARILYLSAQLMLYRDLATDVAIKLFPDDHLIKTPSTILSADLCLRFMPSLLHKYEAIQLEDSLLPSLRKVMSKWSYSAIDAGSSPEGTDWEVVLQDRCLLQLTIDRIIERGAMNYATSEIFVRHVTSALGDYGAFFWKEFEEKIRRQAMSPKEE